MMKNMNKTGTENLCNGIVEQSAKDYANAFMGKRTLTEDGLIKLCIAKKNNKDSMTYTIPPRLMSEFNKAITFCIAQLEAEKEKLFHNKC